MFRSKVKITISQIFFLKLLLHYWLTASGGKKPHLNLSHKSVLIGYRGPGSAQNTTAHKETEGPKS